MNLRPTKQEAEEMGERDRLYREREIRHFMEYGFDETAAETLHEAGVQSSKAYRLVVLYQCPLDLAFEILI